MNILDRQILTLDVGTTSVKVSIFSDKLDLIASTTQEYTLDTYENGLVECDVKRYTDAITSGIGEVIGQGTNIVALGVTTQGETLILTDDSGNPLSKAIVWLDSRANDQATKLKEKIDDIAFYKTTGLPEINGALPIAKLMWIKEMKPELYKAAKHCLLLEDYLLFWLTGRFVTEKSLQCSTGWFDIINDCYWKEAIEAAELDLEKLPIALSCGEPIGVILESLAKKLNISKEAIVVTGAMDQTATALAMGVTRDGVLCETTGTALVMAAYTQNPNFEQSSRVTIYRHAIDGAYLYIPIGNTGGMALTWFRDNFCKELCGNIYLQMDEMASQINAGCDGLITLPYLSGCVNPDNEPNARAVYFGASMNTTRSHFIRSTMEAIGFQLRDFIEMLENLGVSATEVHSIGGGSKSPLWEQIKADICKIPFVTSKSGEAASLGVAILAAYGCGILENLNIGQQEFSSRYIPNERLQYVYDKTYQKSKQLYNAVKPLFS